LRVVDAASGSCGLEAGPLSHTLSVSQTVREHQLKRHARENQRKSE
jgi:hypothetical protein